MGRIGIWIRHTSLSRMFSLTALRRLELRSRDRRRTSSRNISASIPCLFFRRYGKLLAIANEFQLPTHVIFESWVQCTAVLRNLCCHHNRVWNRRYAVKPKLPKTLPLAWITQFDPIPTKIYWQLCCLLYMENAIHPGNGFSQSLKSLFAKYPSVNQSAMGFPKGWDLEPLWK